MNPSDFEFCFMNDPDFGPFVHFQGKSGFEDGTVEDLDNLLEVVGLENLNGNDYGYDLANWNYASKNELKQEIEAIGFIYNPNL